MRIGIAGLLEHLLEGEGLVRLWFFRCGVPGGETFGHGGCVADGDFSSGEYGIELFTDAAVVVAGDGFAEGECFEGDASECFRVGRAGDDRIADRHNFAQVGAVADEGNIFFEFSLIDGSVEVLVEVLFSRVCFSDEETMDGEAFFFEGCDDFEEVEGAFPTGEATGQGDDKFVFCFGEFFSPLSEPFFSWLVVGRVGCRVDSAMDNAEFMMGHFGVVFMDVVLDAGGDADDGFTFGHDGGVGIDGVESVYGGDEARSSGGGHFSPGQPGEPCGYAGTGVEDVGLFGFEEVTQGADLGEGENGFLVNGELSVFAPFVQ